MGLGGPMTWWDTELCVMLAAAGFYVVRYDNRDTGRSTRIRARVKRSQLVRAFGGRKVKAPYSMSDLAGDAVALMDHLGLESAHVAGISMGGMIAQTVAVEHPRRVRSLTSIMSTTGKRTVGLAGPAPDPGAHRAAQARPRVLRRDQRRLLGRHRLPRLPRRPRPARRRAPARPSTAATAPAA